MSHSIAFNIDYTTCFDVVLVNYEVKRNDVTVTTLEKYDLALLNDHVTIPNHGVTLRQRCNVISCHSRT